MKYREFIKKVEGLTGKSRASLETFGDKELVSVYYIPPTSSKEYEIVDINMTRLYDFTVDMGSGKYCFPIKKLLHLVYSFASTLPQYRTTKYCIVCGYNPKSMAYTFVDNEGKHVFDYPLIGLKTNPERLDYLLWNAHDALTYIQSKSNAFGNMVMVSQNDVEKAIKYDK